MPLALPNLSMTAPAPRIDGIRVVCLDELDFSPTESGGWPSHLLFFPRVGDMIQSSNGTVKKIIEVMHYADESGQPQVMLRLGQDNTTNTATSGSGGSTAVPE